MGPRAPSRIFSHLFELLVAFPVSISVNSLNALERSPLALLAAWSACFRALSLPGDQTADQLHLNFIMCCFAPDNLRHCVHKRAVFFCLPGNCTLTNLWAFGAFRSSLSGGESFAIICMVAACSWVPSLSFPTNFFKRAISCCRFGPPLKEASHLKSASLLAEAAKPLHFLQKIMFWNRRFTLPLPRHGSCMISHSCSPCSPAFRSTIFLAFPAAVFAMVAFRALTVLPLESKNFWRLAFGWHLSLWAKRMRWCASWLVTLFGTPYSHKGHFHEQLLGSHGIRSAVLCIL